MVRILGFYYHGPRFDPWLEILEAMQHGQKKVIVGDTSVLLLQDFLDSHCIKVSALKLSLKNTKNKTTTKNTKNKTPKFNPAFADNNIRNE